MVITIGLIILLILFVSATVCFVMATASMPSPARFQWHPAGMVFLTIALAVMAMAPLF